MNPKILKDIDIIQVYQKLQKLEAEFYSHNHNDIVPPPKGDKSNILTARFLKVGSSLSETPAIQIASISNDPASPSNGDMWFDGTYLHIRFAGKTAHIVATTTSSSTSTTTTTTTTTTSSSTTTTIT